MISFLIFKMLNYKYKIIKIKKMKTVIKKIIKWGIKAFLLGIILLSVIYLIIYLSTKNKIYEEVSDIPKSQTVLVLGARVYSNGALSDILRDRLDTAIEIYKAGKADKVLVSGDHGRAEYDEVNAMKDYLLKKGVASKNIFLDHAGFDTYDSIYRAQYIFEVESLIISTQKFHLPRSIYIANRLGVEANGIVADKHIYIAEVKFYLREKLAQVKAFLELFIKAKPKFLGEKIPITGDSKKSWD